MGEKLYELLYFFPAEWKIFILSAVPITELRATIPLAIGMGMDPTIVLFYALLGNFLPIIPLLFGLPYLLIFLEKVPVINRIALSILAKTRAKSNLLHKYGFLGLIVIVSIPLPGTGVWTGSLAAFLFGMPIKMALPAITIGMIIAGILVTLASIGLVKMLSVSGFAVWILVFLVLIFCLTIKIKK